MTVSSQTPINRSTGNGVTTVFPYGFKIISEADIEVTVDGVVKTLNVDYTVSGVGNEAGGNVTMTAAPANLSSVVRRRNMALVRTTDYQDQGEMPAATLDNDFDSAVLMIQQVDEQIGRAVTVPAGVTGFDGQLPDPVSSMFLRINSAADGFDLVSEVTPGALTVTPFIETLLNDTDATAARVTLGAQVAGSYQAAGSYAASGANADITSLGALTAGGLPDNSVLTSDIANAAVTPAKLSQPFTLLSAVSLNGLSAGGYTGIPDWADEIVLNFDQLSTTGTAIPQVQVGSGSYASSGYLSSAVGGVPANVLAGAVVSSGFSLLGAAAIAANVYQGSLTLTRVTGNVWNAAGSFSAISGSASFTVNGRIALGGALDRVQIITADAFDGSAQISGNYKG